MILKCENVTKQFGKLYAVDDLSFEVEQGIIFGIAGTNGSGKTTAFNLITGIYPFTGDIIFNGEKISGMTPYRICHKGIARTFQIPQLFLTLPLIENVRASAHFGNPGANHNEMETIKEVLDFVGLAGKENTIAANLKLLDKKLAMIATALATKPKMLLLDEPIAGLNPTEIRQSIELFKRINQDLGVTILIIEHFMKVLTELSQRLMILENGAKICIGPPHEVTEDPRVIETYLGGCYA
jgi:branched-chain amino acid transport system ATP-binding protein